MNDEDYEVRYQASILVDALHRNINNNFASISFEIMDNGDIILLILLINKTCVEEEYIEDIIAEFEGLQLTHNVEKVEILIEGSIEPLKNVVYRRKEWSYSTL